MRPTIERAYWEGDFETAEAQKARTRQGRRIATRVTKSGVREFKPRIASNARASSGREEGGGGKTAIDLYMTLWTPAGSL
jgi:hypothetical protein